MRWRIIKKNKSCQPTRGSYRDWKPLLADEGYHRCVYCAIHDASFGGIRNFHVEHYRPKSLFPDLRNVFSNLFYACPICNTFKGNDWPEEPMEDCSVRCYPDPSLQDFNHLFDNDHSSGLVQGNTTASKYMVEKIHLNRQQLVSERRFQANILRGKNLRRAISDLLTQSDLELDDHLQQLKDQYCRFLEQSLELRDRLLEITPYEPEDTRR